MAEYIEREALMVALCEEITGDGDYYNGKDDMQDEIRDMVSRFPAADVATVRHGRWRYFHKQNIAVCTECSFERDLDTNFGRAVNCPNCGAKMDG